MPPDDNAPKIIPFMTIDADQRKRVFEEWQNKTPAEQEAEYNNLNAEVERCWDQARGATDARGDGDGDFDIGRINVYGGTRKEKVTKVTELLTNQAGVGDAMRESRSQQQHIEEIMNRDNRPEHMSESDWKDLAKEAVAEALGRAARSPDLVFNLVKDQSKEQELPEIGTPDWARLASSRAGIELVGEYSDDRLLNVLFQTSDGWAPESVREAGYTPSRRVPIQMIDIMPRMSINQAAAVYMEETVYNNQAGAVAEGASSPELELQLEQRTVNVRKVSGHIPVTREELEDEPQVRSYLNETVPFMVRQRIDGYLIDGSNSDNPPEPIGLTNATNVQNTDFAAARANAWNTLRTARTRTSVEGQCMPTHYAFHPYIWDEIILQQMGTTASREGFYLGSPADNFEERAWGLPVVLNQRLSSADTSNSINGLVGDFSPAWCSMRIRRMLEVEIGLSNDDFLRETVRIKASARYVNVWKRGHAFRTISMP